MAAVEQIPILLLTGFLGSGKTTLLARWLRSSDLAGALVIVNELGEVGLDQELVARGADTPLLLDNGCLCCSAATDLEDTLERLGRDQAEGRSPRFDRLVVETTGLADPTPICEAILGSASIAARYRLDGVVTTLDVTRGTACLTEFSEARRQLEAAAVVVLTKADLAGPERIAELQGVMPEYAPHARILVSAGADLPARAVVDAMADAVPFHAQPAPGASAQHTPDISTAFLPAPRPVPLAALMSALDEAMTGRRETLLRLKGLVRFEGAGGLHAVQAVPGHGISRTLVPERAGADIRTGFTIISRSEPAAVVAAAITSSLKRRRDAAPASHAGAP